MVRIAGPRLKRRAPGFRRDRRGLSHSDNSHTTIYRLNLPSVAHAGCAGLHTRQSRTELASEETAVISAMARTQAHAVSTRQRLGGRIFRAAMRADGRWIMRRAAGRGPVECRVARDYLVTLIMQKVAVEWRSTLPSVATVECW